MNHAENLQARVCPSVHDSGHAPAGESQSTGNVWQPAALVIPALLNGRFEAKWMSRDGSWKASPPLLLPLAIDPHKKAPDPEAGGERRPSRRQG